jgi:hypothetical protein
VFRKQHTGVADAEKKVGTYKRRVPTPPPPDIVEQLALFALDKASGGLLSLVTNGINAAGGGWTKGTPGESGWGFSTPGTPGTKELAVSPAGAVVSFVVGKMLAKSTEKIKGAITNTAQDAGGGTAASESKLGQIDFFGSQSDVLADKQLETKLNSIELRRSLIDYNNPRDAGQAAAVIEAAAASFKAESETARKLQAEESTKGWVRYVSHSAMGSTSTDEAAQKGLKKTKDGSATARIEHADSARVYDGVIELEFDADANNAGKEVRLSSARLFGVAEAAAASLGLSKKALRTAALPIRLRSSAKSSPVNVTIARDEAGNVRFTDESGAAGMPGHWLSRRGGRPGSESAAQRAAKNLIDDVAGKTLTQLGVTLETDGTDA